MCLFVTDIYLSWSSDLRKSICCLNLLSRRGHFKQLTSSIPSSTTEISQLYYVKCLQNHSLSFLFLLIDYREVVLLYGHVLFGLVPDSLKDLLTPCVFTSICVWSTSGYSQITQRTEITQATSWAFYSPLFYEVIIFVLFGLLCISSPFTPPCQVAIKMQHVFSFWKYLDFNESMQWSQIITHDSKKTPL